MLLLLIISLEIEGKNINIITWISLRSLFYNYGQSRLAEITCYIRQIQINLENKCISNCMWPLFLQCACEFQIKTSQKTPGPSKWHIMIMLLQNTGWACTHSPHCWITPSLPSLLCHCFIHLEFQFISMVYIVRNMFSVL